MKAKELNKLSKTQLRKHLRAMVSFFDLWERLIMHNAPRNISELYVKRAYKDTSLAQQAFIATKVANLFPEVVCVGLEEWAKHRPEYKELVFDLIFQGGFSRWSNTVWFEDPDKEDYEKDLKEIDLDLW